jgi:molecular chaperone GrpE
MFFKKKKTMSDKAFEKEQEMNEHADKMAHDSDAMDEAIARELNVDDSVSGMQHLDDEMADNEEVVDKLQNELDETKDKYLRLVAEFDNFRRRTAKESNELRATAGKELIQSLLVVLDDMERAEKQIEKANDIAAVKEGVSLVFSKLKSTLQHKGLKVMESINQPFDADLHEAITEIPAPNEGMVGKVMDVVEPGYYLNDKLIRFAKVVVGK